MGQCGNVLGKLCQCQVIGSVLPHLEHALTNIAASFQESADQIGWIDVDCFFFFTALASSLSICSNGDDSCQVDLDVVRMQCHFFTCQNIQRKDAIVHEEDYVGVVVLHKLWCHESNRLLKARLGLRSLDVSKILKANEQHLRPKDGTSKLWTQRFLCFAVITCCYGISLEASNHRCHKKKWNAKTSSCLRPQGSSVPKGNFAQRGVSGAAEGLDSLLGGNTAQRLVDRSGLGAVWIDVFCRMDWLTSIFKSYA